MSSWRILLGGVASASVLGVSVAAPTLTRPVSHVRDLPASSLTQVVPASSLKRVGPAPAPKRVVTRGRAARGVGCDLPGLPQAGPVVSAIAGALGRPCGSSDMPGGSWSDLTGAKSPAAVGPANASRRAVRTRPGLPAVTSAIFGLSAVTSAVPGLSGVTSVVSGRNTARSVAGRLASASALTGALSSLGGAFGGAQLGSYQP